MTKHESSVPELPHRQLRGYSDRPDTAPGEQVDFFVSADTEQACNARLLRLSTNCDASGMLTTGRTPIVHPSGSKLGFTARRQRTEIGNRVEIVDTEDVEFPSGLTLHLYMCAGLPERGRQVLMSQWADESVCGWSLELEAGTVALRIGDGSGGDQLIRLPRRVFARTWYALTVVIDVAGNRIWLRQRSVVGSASSVFGPVVPIDTDCEISAKAEFAPGKTQVPIMIGAAAESEREERIWSVAHFNGKIGSPALWSQPLPADFLDVLESEGTVSGDHLFGMWDFAIDPASDEIQDVSGNNRVGRQFNQLERGMTGWNWAGTEDCFRHAPAQYGAAGFHADALADCRWQLDLQVELPRELPSGCYCLEVTNGIEVDEIPFFVRPAQPRSKIALLIPTLTYLVYSNYRNASSADQPYDPWESVLGGVTIDLRDFEFGRHPETYGLSPYDRHRDGTGVQHNTWRKPSLTTRPEAGDFAVDLMLVGWLDALGFEYDVITDHDLIREGFSLLEPYSVVVTGSHPEYYTSGMVDAWEHFLAVGGRGMYLGGNGMYWVTAVHPEKPWLAEIRRGETGDAAWKSRPGERYHAFTGELGGLWRNRGRAPNKIWGVGYVAHGSRDAGAFIQLPAANDPRVAWIIEGVDPQGPDRTFGQGAAGVEVDAMSRDLGTPPNALLLAASVNHSADARLTAEEIGYAHPGMDGEQHPRVRADIVYFTTSKGGGMFSASSMAWCRCLHRNTWKNDISTVTSNVLRRFADESPLPPVE
jgi:N,N-dimethylformamidase